MSVDSGMLSGVGGGGNVNDANTPLAATPDHSAVLSGSRSDSAADRAFAFESPARSGSVGGSVGGNRRRVCLRFEKTYAMKVDSTIIIVRLSCPHDPSPNSNPHDNHPHLRHTPLAMRHYVNNKGAAKRGR